MAEQIPLCVLLDEFSNPVGVKQFPAGDTLPEALIPTISPKGSPFREVAVSGTITPADAGYLIISTSATPITLTLGAEATAAWTIAGISPIVNILQAGAGAVTIAGDGFVIAKPATDTLVLDGTGAAASLLWSAADTWYLVGRLVAA